MKARMKLSNSGYIKLKNGEACRLKAYLCPAGKWTIGWGQTGANIVKGTVWTQTQADDALVAAVRNSERAINVGVRVTLLQCQYDALVLFIYNIGVGAFGESTMRDYLNASKFAEAHGEFPKWNKVTNPVTKRKEVSDGLINRRAMEANVFIGKY